jgi:hypothetical protein
VLEMSSAKSSQAVVLALLAGVAGYFAFFQSTVGPVSASGDVDLSWPTLAKMVFSLLGGSAILSRLGFLGPLLPMFKSVMDHWLNTTPAPTPAIKRDPEPKAETADDSFKVALDLGAMGVYAGLHKATTDAGERAKIREAASILSDKLFDSWFPMESAK